MALDDAIDKARRQSAHREQQERLRREAELRAQHRLAELGAEAAQKLARVPRASVHLMKAVPAETGNGQGGKRYRQIAAQWCWPIKVLREGSAGQWPTVLLLLENGTPISVTCNFKSNSNQFVTSLAPKVVSAADYPDQSIVSLLDAGWIDDLERDLADAIVRYEATT